MKLSIVMPAYNEERTISKILDVVLAQMKEISDIVKDYEIIIINDFSNDKTLDILEKGYGQNSKIKVYSQSFNQGKGAAITRGFQETNGDIVLIQDADLEYDPADYRKLLTPFINNNADVVYGSRFKGEATRILHYWHCLGNKFLTTLSNMFSNLNLTDMETCYKVFRGDLIRSMNFTSKRFGIEPEITAKIAKIREIRIYEVPISYHGRTYAEGRKIGWRDGFSAIWSIIKFNLL